MIWVHDTGKQQRDAAVRGRRIAKATTAIGDLAARLASPRSRLRTAAAVHDAAAEAIAAADATKWVRFAVRETTEVSYRQASRGRPGPDTAYRRIEKKAFQVTCEIDAATVAYDAVSDGCWPLITDAVVIGDLSAIESMRGIAEQVNALGHHNAVIHNAGVGYREPRRIQTADGLSHVFAINVLAPYLLTALITRPQRLVYLSSGMHAGGDAALDDPQWEKRRWNGAQAYSDSKLNDVLLAFAVARRWPGVRSNAVEPGWVPTKMGGAGAPDDLSLAPVTQAWLAAGEDPRTDVTGEYFYHQKVRRSHPAARDPHLQDALLDYCAAVTSTPCPIRDRIQGRHA